MAQALGYSNTRDALNKHVDDEDKLESRIATSGQNRKVIIINESGLYSLIFSSKLQQAKTFKRWVTSEVQPKVFQLEYVNKEGRFVCEGHTCYIWKNDRLRCKGCFISAMLERRNNRDLLADNE